MMITLSTARLMLEDPQRVPALLDEMEGMSAAALDELRPLVFDVISLKDRHLSLMGLKRMMALRPEWVNKKEATGSRPTPLIAAVKQGCLATVDFLLDAGAQAHAVDTGGFNALDHASRQQISQPVLPQVYEALLEKGGFTLQQKNTALYCACATANLPAITALLAHRADFTKGMPKGTALGAACRAPQFYYPAMEAVSAMLKTSRGRQAVNQGWDPSNEDYGAPIHCAASVGNVGVLSVLVSAGACVNPPPEHAKDNPTTPLMRAAMRAELGAIEFLINAGADAGLINTKGHNALHCLANANCDHYEDAFLKSTMIKAVDVLVAAGADPFAEDHNELMPQDTARENGNFFLAEHLAAITSARGLSSRTADPAAQSPAAPGPRL